MVGARELLVLRFDERTVPAEHQFEAFHETVAPVADTRPTVSSARFRASATYYLIDGIMVSHLCYGPQVMRRGVGHTSVGGDCLGVLLHRRGGMRGTIDADAAFEVDPEHIAIIDLANPFACWVAEGDLIWVTIPRARLGSLPWPTHAAYVNFHRKSPRGRVLTAAVEHLFVEIDQAPAPDEGGLASSIVEAVRSVLDPGDFAPRDDDLVRAIKDHIVANIADLSLGPNSLCQRFFCSRSTLYRLFKPDGGVAGFIRAQRLVRCFDELASTSRPIADTATRWGFENPSHFNRLFKAMFGTAPSTVVAPRADDFETLTAAPLPVDQIAQFHDWTTSL